MHCMLFIMHCPCNAWPTVDRVTYILWECLCYDTQVQLVLFPFPTAAGVPYSVVVHAETGGGRGAESERVTFFSRELGQLRLPGHTLYVLYIYCARGIIYTSIDYILLYGILL